VYDKPDELNAKKSRVVYEASLCGRPDALAESKAIDEAVEQAKLVQLKGKEEAELTRRKEALLHEVQNEERAGDGDKEKNTRWSNPQNHGGSKWTESDFEDSRDFDLGASAQSRFQQSESDPFVGYNNNHAETGGQTFVPMTTIDVPVASNSRDSNSTNALGSSRDSHFPISVSGSVRGFLRIIVWSYMIWMVGMVFFSCFACWHVVKFGTCPRLFSCLSELCQCGHIFNGKQSKKSITLTTDRDKPGQPIVSNSNIAKGQGPRAATSTPNPSYGSDDENFDVEDGSFVASV
jgi:hypothetical protein